MKVENGRSSVAGLAAGLVAGWLDHGHDHVAEPRTDDWTSHDRTGKCGGGATRTPERKRKLTIQANPAGALI